MWPFGKTGIAILAEKRPGCEGFCRRCYHVSAIDDPPVLSASRSRSQLLEPRRWARKPTWV